MNGKKIPIADIKRWIEDPEHGLFHGMCTALWSMYLTKRLKTTGHFSRRYRTRNLRTGTESEGNKRVALILTSGIFHDFARVALGDESNHDGALRGYFEDLSEDTYTHANPKEKTRLVAADRFELTRFDDWSDWVEKDKIDHRIAPYLDSFISIRECLRRFTFWEGPWIQHGFEGIYLGHRHRKKQEEEKTWPLQGSYLVKGGWAAEVMLEPFGECQDHYQKCQDNLGEKRVEPAFKKIVGLTTCSRMEKMEPASRTDHLVGRQESDIDNWVFYYKRDTESHPLVQSWIRRGLPILPYDIVKKWDEVRRKLIAMFIAERAEY